MCCKVEILGKFPKCEQKHGCGIGYVKQNENIASLNVTEVKTYKKREQGRSPMWETSRRNE